MVLAVTEIPFFAIPIPAPRIIPFPSSEKESFFWERAVSSCNRFCFCFFSRTFSKELSCGFLPFSSSGLTEFSPSVFLLRACSCTSFFLRLSRCELSLSKDWFFAFPRRFPMRRECSDNSSFPFSLSNFSSGSEMVTGSLVNFPSTSSSLLLAKLLNVFCFFFLCPAETSCFSFSAGTVSLSVIYFSNSTFSIGLSRASPFPSCLIFVFSSRSISRTGFSLA